MQEQGKERAGDRAYRILRKAILQGHVPTDRKLTEAGLAQSLDLSRTPVREAVKRLLLEGLLQRQKGHGLRCVLPTADEIHEIFDIRARLESYAARRAAINATTDQIAELRASAERMADLIDRAEGGRDEPDIFTQIDLENTHFHSLITSAARTKRLSHLLQSTIDAGLVTMTWQHYTPDQRTRSVAHHFEIAEAIAAGQPEWAERIMQVHILAAAASVINN